MTPEERYRYEERLGILGAMGRPTPEQHAEALKDVHTYQESICREAEAAQFRAETARQGVLTACDGKERGKVG